jgi:hypothetical protein
MDAKTMIEDLPGFARVCPDLPGERCCLNLDDAENAIACSLSSYNCILIVVVNFCFSSRI